MELINRYVHQVGRKLPRRLRADVETELRSLLLDALEERAKDQAEGDTQFSEKEQAAILKEFGPPAQMAAQYQPQPQYLIGPKLYNVYLAVIAAMMGAGLVASIVITIISMLFKNTTGIALLAALGKGWSTFFSIALNGFAFTTLTFIILERVLPDEKIELEDIKDWSPHDLPPIKDHNQINMAGLIAEIVFTALFLIVFTAFPDTLSGVYYNKEWHVLSVLLSDAFFALYLPLIAIRWSLGIIQNLVLLRQQRWQLGTRISDLCLHGLDIFILGWILIGPSILSDSLFAAMSEISSTLASLINNVHKLAFGVVLVITIIETVGKLYRIIQSQTKVKAPVADL